MLHPLQHLQLVVYHLLVSFDILLEDNFHGDFASWSIGLPDNTICTSTQRFTESIFGPENMFVSLCMKVKEVLYTSYHSSLAGREAC